MHARSVVPCIDAKTQLTKLSHHDCINQPVWAIKSPCHQWNTLGNQAPVDTSGSSNHEVWLMTSSCTALACALHWAAQSDWTYSHAGSFHNVMFSCACLFELWITQVYQWSGAVYYLLSQRYLRAGWTWWLNPSVPLESAASGLSRAV